MKLTKNELLAGAGIVVGITSSVAGFGTMVASADSTSTNQPSSSAIASSVIREDTLEAEAKVLNMTTAEVQDHLKAHDLKQVLVSQGLDTQTSRQSVQAQLKSELQAQGYSQTQIDAVLQQHYQHHSKQS